MGKAPDLTCEPPTGTRQHWRGPGRLALAAAFVLAGAALGATPSAAQGWSWPWDEKPKPPPIPPAPIAGPAAQPQPPAVGQPPPVAGQPAAPAAPAASWAQRATPVCLELERRLVQEGQKGSPAQEQLPLVERQLAEADQLYRQSRQQLDRADCYETFFFTKTLKQSRRCIDLQSQTEGARRRLSDLESQRSQLLASSGRSYRDEIVRELARNNCGDRYSQQVARQSSSPSGGIWSEGEDAAGQGGLGTYSAQPYATYRTVCVRLCDGYFFPVSFSTLPNHFDRDAEACQSKCAAPAELYYYQNPGGSTDDMVGYQTSQPYNQLRSAFRYRKEYVAGCSCKETEYLPEGGTPREAAAPGGATASALGAPPPATDGEPAAAIPPAATSPSAAAGGWAAETGRERLPWETQ